MDVAKLDGLPPFDGLSRQQLELRRDHLMASAGLLRQARWW
jgi:hypothetical protein